MKTASIESQVAALSALQSRLSEGSFATGTVTRLHGAAGALADIISASAKTADTPERKAQRVSDAGNKYLEAVNRATADLNAREIGGKDALNQQFADRVNLTTDGYRYSGQVLDAIRAADQTQKIAMLTQIVESGDGRPLAAILEAPQFTHGIDKGMLDRFRDSMESKWAPDITQKRERFDLDLATANTALSAAEQIAKTALQVENVSETLAQSKVAREAEQRLEVATA